MRKLFSRLQGSHWRWSVLALPAACAVIFFCAIGLVMGVDTTTVPSDLDVRPAIALADDVGGEVAVPATAPTTSATGADEAGATVAAPSQAGNVGATGAVSGADVGLAAVDLPVVDVDVVVFSTQTSGLAAVHELKLGAPHLKVALISAGNLLETPLAQGLSAEDARDIERVAGGYYGKWRRAVIDYYGRRGLSAFTSSGRLVYEPEVAAKALWTLLGGQGVVGQTSGNLSFYSAHLVAASDQGDSRYVDVRVEGRGLLRIKTRFFIDASVEGDLARMLGADYRVGRHEGVYNDVSGVKPAYPGSDNAFETAPQRFSALLTLKIHKGVNAPPISRLFHPNYNPVTYATMGGFSQKNVTAFKSSWSMTIAVLPNSKRELNETWSDWPDVGLAFQWVFSPERRGDIRRRVLEWSINRVRYLQEHGYPRVGIATIPQKLYVREGPRIVGLDTYTVGDLHDGVVRDPIALGCYCEYDRHDAFYPTHVEQTRYARVPMGALLARDHPWLLVTTGVSTDYQAYSSAVRMEHTRSAMGAAAGIIVVVADRFGLHPQQIPYAKVRSLLLQQGYRLDIGG